MLPECYHVHTISMSPSTLARRMFCYYYNWKTITRLLPCVQPDVLQPRYECYQFETICTRPALQAVEWGVSSPIDLSTFPPLCIPAHSWFPRDFKRSYSTQV